jgi:hypothetical protein
MNCLLFYSNLNWLDNKRTRSASSAFWALPLILTKKHIDLSVKGSAYVENYLRILIYGCLIWCLGKVLFNRLAFVISFHCRCIRTTCRITIAHSTRHHIVSVTIPMDRHRRSFVVYPSLKKIFACWVDNLHPLGCPQMNWGWTLKKKLFS